MKNCALFVVVVVVVVVDNLTLIFQQNQGYRLNRAQFFTENVKNIFKLMQNVFWVLSIRLTYFA